MGIVNTTVESSKLQSVNSGRLYSESICSLESCGEELSLTVRVAAVRYILVLSILEEALRHLTLMLTKYMGSGVCGMINGHLSYSPP